MVKFAMVALGAGACGLLAAGTIVHYRPQPLVLRAAEADSTPAALVDDSQPATANDAIVRSADGHYWADGDVGGRDIRFLVDTGATAVALTPADAARLGIRPADLTYAYKVVTAAGPVRAAAVKLTSVSVAGVRVDNVDALVIEKGLDTSLLGMSYLGRLSSFQATRDGLFLQP